MRIPYIKEYQKIKYRLPRKEKKKIIKSRGRIFFQNDQFLSTTFAMFISDETWNNEMNHRLKCYRIMKINRILKKIKK
jgi:hypothetical protein